MKKNITKYILFLAMACSMPACQDLDLPPLNVVQDDDVFGSVNGINSYLARVYSGMPMEDFRYSPERGLFNFWTLTPTSVVCGEAINGDQGGARDEGGQYWGDAYSSLRDINYFLETLPKYEANFQQSDIDKWKGEMLFNRAFVYFALAKRYGGVPIVNKVLNYPQQSPEELITPRSSEEDVWEQVKKDCDDAFNLLPETNDLSRATRYAALALKSRAMLHAGSIAKYNNITLKDDKGNLLCGLPKEKAKEYFQESYKASKLLEGHFDLYKDDWKEGDKQAQYENFVNMFFKDESPENILIRQYLYPNSVHGYDCYNIPRQFMKNGYSSYVSPTVEFVEMFEGFPKDENGKIENLDAAGNYKLFDNLTDFFKDAEPRLRATVLLPGDTYYGQSVEVWRGVYIGAAGGIKPLRRADVIGKYESDAELMQKLKTSKDFGNPGTVTLPSGGTMKISGASGIHPDGGANTKSGFYLRKYMNEDMDPNLVMENRSDQSWIEFRYGEILLNRAEAAFELAELGVSVIDNVDMKEDAFACINEIRSRAGATKAVSAAALTLDDIRTERRKELGFENKIWWDLKRWRIMDSEQNNKIYRIFVPFFAQQEEKWFFDVCFDENGRRYTFDTRWYYEDIPGDAITKDHLVQNPGY